MQLKNKAERERFLENYKNWELMHEVPELELKFYRYVFPNGTVIIATEYACICWADYDADNNKHIFEKVTRVNYHLLLSENDNFVSKYKYSETAYKFYNPAGDGKSDIIKYLTNPKLEIDSPGDSDV